jgi:hypothetical protein
MVRFYVLARGAWWNHNIINVSVETRGFARTKTQNLRTPLRYETQGGVKEGPRLVVRYDRAAKTVLCGRYATPDMKAGPRYLMLGTMAPGQD